MKSTRLEQFRAGLPSGIAIFGLTNAAAVALYVLFGRQAPTFEVAALIMGVGCAFGLFILHPPRASVFADWVAVLMFFAAAGIAAAASLYIQALPGMVPAPLTAAARHSMFDALAIQASAISWIFWLAILYAFPPPPIYLKASLKLTSS